MRARALFSIAVLAVLGVIGAGCELIVDFDRDKIGADAGRDAFVPPTDSGSDDGGETDAGEDAAVEDAAVEDAAVEDAAMEDAGPTDAGMEDAGPMDAGMEDAGPPDAGTDAGPTMTCGNGTVEGTEACDDDNTVTETECAYGTMSCMICNATCTAEIGVTGRYCGDGTTDSGDGEDCDSGGVDTATCDSDCTDSVCGDGHLNMADGEECDDGDTMAGDGCSSTCTTEPADAGTDAGADAG